MVGKRILILFITAILVTLTACGGGNQIVSSEVSEESVSSGSVSLEIDSSKSNSSASSSWASGLGVDNYPRIDGSTANLPLMAKLYSEICSVSLEDAETLVQASGGTGAVWRNMMYGGADLLLVYEAPENIKAEMNEMGLLDQLEITPIGRDGLVFLVNAQNPVDSLTREQLIGIYTGAVKDWSDVGGESGHIAAFQRNQESGSQTLFLSLLMQQIEPMKPPSELRPAGMGALIDAVAEYDGSSGAIGFSVYYYANLTHENPSLKLLAVNGVSPSAQSIENGTYPLVNDFYVVIRKNEPENSPARILRDWLLTDKGRQLLIDTNYVPVSKEGSEQPSPTEVQLKG